MGPDTSPAVKLALATEQAEHQDLLLIPSNHTSRAFTPLLVTFRWFMLATSEPPYREAQFIAKLDDDVYLHVPEFASHLQSVVWGAASIGGLIASYLRCVCRMSPTSPLEEA